MVSKCLEQLVVREVVDVWFLWRISESEGRPLTDLTDWIPDWVEITEASDFAKSDVSQYLVGPIQIHFLFVFFFFEGCLVKIKMF